MGVEKPFGRRWEKGGRRRKRGRGGSVGDADEDEENGRR
jgi:hypothetical protein